ncbi:unnamed protein product [Boreogadus saida]
MCSAACVWDGACGTGRVVSWKQSTSAIREISHAFPGHIPGDGLMPDAVTRDSVKTHKGRRSSVMKAHKNQLPRDAPRQLTLQGPEKSSEEETVQLSQEEEERQLSDSRHAASSGPASGAWIQQRPSLRGLDPAAAQPPGPGSSSGPASGAWIQQRHHSNQQCAH